MPEASIDKDNLFPAWKDKVGFAWKSGSGGGAMEAEPIAGSMQQAPDQELRFGVLAAYPGHIGTALLRGDRICHATSLGAAGRPRGRLG